MTRGNFRRLLLTFEALSDLGREITADRDFPQTARVLLRSLCDAVGALEGALFSFSPRPAALSSISAQGFAAFPEVAVVPLLPRHVHALSNTRGPLILAPGSHDLYLTSNGNIAPELLKCLAPLRVGSKLVGVLALGRRADDAAYDRDELDAIAMLANYIALAVQNHELAKSLETRIAENLRLLGSLHSFYDSALEAFAAAIDIKDANVHGHSLRVGRYAAAIGEALDMEAVEVAGLKASGYLHDIGMIAVDKRIWSKPGALDDQEFREMADHTIVGHRIVSGIEFPWTSVPDAVRGHHERADGSGYPDHLRLEEIAPPVRIIAVADSFDAMTSERPYRRPMTVGAALSELVRLTPLKFDPVSVQGLLTQIRRDSTGSNRTPFLDGRLACNIAPNDVDQLTANLLHKLSNGRVYNA